MSVGTRQQPEKDLDRTLRPKSWRRISRKALKAAQNRKARRLARIDPEAGPMPKYRGWEW